MIDFFGIITKGGLVLWYFQDVAQRLEPIKNATNSLIKDVVLQVSKFYRNSLMTILTHLFLSYSSEN